MINKKALIGDMQRIELDFPEAKLHDVYHVDVQVQHPNGIITSHTYSYTFIEKRSLADEPQ